MDFRAEIRTALRDMVKDMLMPAALQCTVKKVDKQAGTIVATSVLEGVDYFNVRLKAVLPDATGAGILAYPVAGSAVSIVLLDGIDTMAFVAQMSEVESWRVQAANGVSIELTAAGELWLNGDGLGGLVKAVELKTQLDKTNALVDAIRTAFINWIPVTGDGGAVLKSAMLSAISTRLVGDFSNIQNDKVKHG